MEAYINKKISRGEYWFHPHLWPPIVVVVQKYGTSSNVVHYLRTTYRSPRVPSPYKKLAKNSLWSWFTTKGEFRPNYLQVAQGTIVRHFKQHLSFFKKYPTLQDDLVTMLQKMRSVGQPLSTSIVQTILRGMVECLALEILQTSHGGFMYNYKGMDKIILTTLHELVFLHGNHYSQQNANILTRTRSEHGIQNSL
jgi:hypothetical protein